MEEMNEDEWKEYKELMDELAVAETKVKGLEKEVEYLKESLARQHNLISALIDADFIKKHDGDDENGGVRKRISI